MQLQQEVGKLRKQLQAVRSKLLQSEQREAEAHVRIESLQQDLAAVRAEAQEAGGKVSCNRQGMTFVLFVCTSRRDIKKSIE